MKHPFKWFCGLLLLLSASACLIKPESDDEEPTINITSFDDGTFITNGGDSQQANTASVDFIDQESGAIVNSIYQKANANERPGDGIRSMQVWGSKAYLLAADADEILITDLKSFKKSASISGFQNPHEMLLINASKLYVSQWGAERQTGSIAVVDLATNSIGKTIPTRMGPVKMVKSGSHVYVCNSGGLFVDSVITKISTATDEVVKTIDAGIVPNSIVTDKNGALWVLCQGILDQLQSSNSIQGSLWKFENDEPISIFGLSTGARNLVIDPLGEQLYFTMDDWIFKHSISAKNLVTVPFIARSFTGLAVHPLTAELYAANSTNQVSAGKVVVFDTSGKEVKSYDTGIFPNGFWFE